MLSEERALCMTTLLRKGCSGENHASFTDINFEKQTRAR